MKVFFKSTIIVAFRLLTVKCIVIYLKTNPVAPVLHVVTYDLW